MRNRLSLLLGCLALLACAQQAPPVDEETAGAQVVASADGVPIAYEARGKGRPAVVLVHGWSCDRSYWDAQVDPLSRRFRVVTLDLAGHGDSGLGRDGWTIEAFGGDVAAVVEELDLESVVLVGHSMGGDVIVEAARRLPDRVEGLVWVDTYEALDDPRTDEEIRERMARFRADFEETTLRFARERFHPATMNSLVEQVARDMSSAPPEVALGALESKLTFDREIPPALEELEVPVVAFNAEEPPTDTASLERHGVDVITLAGVGHFLMIEDPEGFNRRLTEIVDGFVEGAFRHPEGATRELEGGTASTPEPGSTGTNLML